MFKEMENFILKLQDKICKELEKVDNVKFIEDKWSKKNGGGKTKVISGGQIFEKGGVNFSSVKGTLPEIIAKQANVTPGKFSVCGLSIIIHPFSPKIPTIHMNIRYFEMEKHEGRNNKSWFGGGIDLTPYYPNEEDFKFFHRVMKDACNSVIKNSYSQFKTNCDEYFTIKHRNEMRGIGGIFFDYLPGNDLHFELAKSIGNSFLKAYLPIVKKRKKESFSEYDKEFQLIRRGRYIEFNLIYDRGTLFGLKTKGRIESILISMPPEAKFIYNFKPRKNSPHAKMMKYYQPLEWG
jgi:coproporphyrinogen III oxidase